MGVVLLVPVGGASKEGLKGGVCLFGCRVPELMTIPLNREANTYVNHCMYTR